jgi:hypothetical protein
LPNYNYETGLIARTFQAYVHIVIVHYQIFCQQKQFQNASILTAKAHLEVARRVGADLVVATTICVSTGMLWPWPPDVVEKHATGPSEAQQRGLFAPDLMAGFAGSEAVWLSTAL